MNPTCIKKDIARKPRENQRDGEIGSAPDAKATRTRATDYALVSA